jgi:hypothetical protein
VCHLEVESRSLLCWRMLCLLQGDSSNSARMAQRSSVAEITGKRTTITHPRANRHCHAEGLRAAEATLRLHHSQ